jgi:His/Glu/Gln/Arg/opine family amino acid ABC transporter permease subunit
MSNVVTPAILHALLKGAVLSVELSVLTYVLALLFGLIAALMRRSGNVVAKGLARFYIELFRGTPALVQIFFAYFATPQIFAWLNRLLFEPLSGGRVMLPPHLSPFAAAVLALSLGYGAYLAEVIRAGIESIHKGQVEAAASLGLTGGDIMRFVVIPPAIRLMIPPFGNYALALLKDSSLASTISVVELTLSTERAISYNYQPAMMWAAAAVIYLALSMVGSFLFSYLEVVADPIRRRRGRPMTRLQTASAGEEEGDA